MPDEVDGSSSGPLQGPANGVRQYFERHYGCAVGVRVKAIRAAEVTSSGDFGNDDQMVHRLSFLVRIFGASEPALKALHQSSFRQTQNPIGIHKPHPLNGMHGL